MYRPLLKSIFSLGIATGASNASNTHRNTSSSDGVQIAYENSNTTIASFNSISTTSPSNVSENSTVVEHISQSISTRSAPSPSMVRRAVEKAELSGDEIDIAMNNVFSRPDLLEPFVTPHVKAEETETHERVLVYENTEQKMYKAVKSLLTDPGLLEQVCSQFHTAAAADHSEEPGFHTKKIGDIMHSMNVWESLCESHGCCLCLEVLACPTISNCSHTFCGECLDEYMIKVTEDSAPQSTSLLSSSPSIVHYCPLCKEEIKSVTFERLLHRDICSQISAHGINAADVPSMVEWQKRCEIYEMKMQEKRVQEVCRRGDNNADIDIGDRDDEEGWVASVFYLALSVVLIVVMAKSRMKL